MGDLVIGLAKSVVEGTLSKAQSAIEEHGKLRQQAQRDLVFITFEFEMMHAFLSVADQESAAKNTVVRTWVRHVRELAYDVEDCIELVIHLDNKSDWWRRLLPPCIAAAALPLDQAVAEIEQLKARVVDVSSSYMRYNLVSDFGSKSTVAPSAAVGATAPNLVMKAKEDVEGLREFRDLARLINMKKHDLQVISVWGTGSHLGITSIIRKAYNDPEICPNFACRAWVKLIHPFNPQEFIQCLMAQFYANSCEKQGAIVGLQVLQKMEATQENLLKEFANQINGNRYLVVLEGLSSMVEWDAIRTFLPDRKNGSWIIASTEQFEMASLCVAHPYKVLELKQFSAEHSVCAFLTEASQGDGDKGKEISEEHEICSFDKIFMGNKDAAIDWMENSLFVGREPEIDKLCQYAAMARFNPYQVISVWGIAGVGKSALVKKFYYDRVLDSSHFEKFSWVDVCHPLNLTDFSQSLLLDLYSEEDPIKECRQLLEHSNCLVVIDNLQSTEEWDLIQAALVSRSSKSLIIVITTEASIATYCAGRGGLVFNVKCLEPEAAFDLLKNEVRTKNSWQPLNDLKEDAELSELILKCGGIPKVIVGIARLLATKTVTLMDTISSLNHRFMYELETNPEFDLHGLFGWMHSFFRSCPDPLKPCIFYLSVFPRDHAVRRRRLVRRWIAEGYSRDTKDISADESGEKFFSKLIDMSVIQQPPQTVATVFDETRMVSCQVKGFICEYIISQKTEENLDFDLGGRCTMTTQRTGRHLAIWDSWDRDKIVFESIDFSRLRSMTVYGKWKPFLVSKKMKLLRVLDLEDASGVTDDDLEQMVKLLPRLKFLSLRGCIGVSHLPSSLGDLRQLQTLDIRHSSIVNLPENITKLQKLQYIRGGISGPALVKQLSMFGSQRRLVDIVVPRGIMELTALHTLGVVNVNASGGKAILEELEQLTQLRKLGVSGINKRNRLKFFSAISGHCHLESLSVRPDKDSEGCLDGILMPSENLQSLKLHGLLDSLPRGIDLHSKLTKLDLEMTILKRSVIEFLGKLPKICILRLHVKQTEDDSLHFCVYMNGLEDRSYQKVKILKIACSSSLHVTFGSETMRHLELLKISCCSGSSVKVSGLENLTELKEVLIKGSCEDTMEEDLRRQFADRRRPPVFKLEEPTASF